MATYKLKTPITEADIRKLKINDTVYITGTIFTARDQTHKKALQMAKEDKKPPIDMEGLAMFHCGPIAKKENNKWTVVAAGPTTSMNMEPYEPEFIKNFKIRVVIGKGGMGKKTTDAMKQHGAIYGAFTGGTAVLAAKAIKNVKTVEWLDLGMPQALWVFEVENFGPLIVAIDAHGNNLYENLAKKVEENRQKIYEKILK